MHLLHVTVSNRKHTNTLSWVLGMLSFLSLATSLLFKESWLWMDETTSVTLLADPSFLHLNKAVVSALDAHPPLFFWLYWPVNQLVDGNPYLLKLLSIGLFTSALVLFFRFTTRLLGYPLLSFVIITLTISLTYLNYTLATQIRSYCLFLLMGCLYFVSVQPLLKAPLQRRYLAQYLAAGSGLIFVHNFGAIYLAASFAFFSGLLLWSRQRTYLAVLAAHLVVVALWLLFWYPSFQVQSLAGQPASWIPLPTFTSFVTTVAELLPSPSFWLEQQTMPLLPVLRLGLVAGLFLYIAVPRLQQGPSVVVTDPAFGFYLLSGCLVGFVAGAALILSFGYTSVWLSRFQWPSELLLLYQITYAGRQFLASSVLISRLPVYIPLYTVLLTGFMVYQSQKISLFPSRILADLAKLNPAYPVFFESADYFLPVWHHHYVNAFYLLDWQTATAVGNLKNALVDYKILQSMRAKYNVSAIIDRTTFTPTRFPHFYVVDELSRYQFEALIANQQVCVLRVLPTHVRGHRILECTR